MIGNIFKAFGYKKNIEELQENPEGLLADTVYGFVGPLIMIPTVILALLAVFGGVIAFIEKLPWVWWVSAALVLIIIIIQFVGFIIKRTARRVSRRAVAEVRNVMTKAQQVVGKAYGTSSPNRTTGPTDTIG